MNNMRQWRSIYIYFHTIIDFVNEKLLSLECLCGVCVDEWEDYLAEVVLYYFPPETDDVSLW